MMDERETLEVEQIRATIANLNAETAKFVAEGEKYRKEAKYFPIIWAVAFVVAVWTVGKFVFH
jgi:hypothetical protein